jgi:hypothetical protein
MAYGAYCIGYRTALRHCQPCWSTLAAITVSGNLHVVQPCIQVRKDSCVGSHQLDQTASFSIHKKSSKCLHFSSVVSESSGTVSDSKQAQNRITMLLPVILVIAPMLARIDAALYYPDVQTYLLEHILVDNWGAYASNFSSAITPCTNYVTQTGTAALNSGRTTAAQWMRVLFHDFITANVSAGTGGVDASIGFETVRSENSGSAFNDSFTFWKPYVNEAVSSKCTLSMESG